jgi:anion transporter
MSSAVFTKHAPALLVLAAALLVLFLPAPTGAPAGFSAAAALTIFAIGFWAVGALPEYLTAVSFFLLAMIFKVAPANVVFSGFEAGALWLVFGGLIIAAGVQRTGLGRRIAELLVARLAGSYPRIITGVVLVSLALAFLMPSTMGRVLLLVPIVLALADRMGFEPGSNGRTGMVVTVALASFLGPAAILPANVPNNVLAGAAEAYHGITITYFDYLLLHFPVLGALKSVLLVLLICRIFPDRVRGDRPPAERRMRLSREERNLAVILGLALAFFVTDTLHGISPAWVSLAAGVACLMPMIAIVTPQGFRTDVQMGPLFYVAGILGLGALVATSGVGDFLSRLLLDAVRLESGADAYNFFALSAIGMVLGMVATMPGIPAILSPIAGDIAAVTGMTLEQVLMLQVLGFSTLVLPYQVPPVLVALQVGGVPMQQAARVTLPLVALTWVLLIPLDYLWWVALGELSLPAFLL